MGWFKRGMGRWRWVGEDEDGDGSTEDKDKGWVAEWLACDSGPCVEGWFWASPSRMGLNKDGNLTGEDVLGFFRWSVLELSLFGCVFSGVWVGGLELNL